MAKTSNMEIITEAITIHTVTDMEGFFQFQIIPTYTGIIILDLGGEITTSTHISEGDNGDYPLDYIIQTLTEDFGDEDYAKLFGLSIYKALQQVDLTLE